MLGQYSSIIKSVESRFLAFVEILSRQNFLFLTSAHILFNILLQLILLYFFPVNEEHYTVNYPVWRRLALNLLIGPIFETLIFQILLMQLLLRATKGLTNLAVFLSALLFGLWHDANFTNVLAGFTAGLTLGTLFFVFKRKRQSPFIFITLVHSAFNLSATIINAFL